MQRNRSDLAQLMNPANASQVLSKKRTMMLRAPVGVRLVVGLLLSAVAFMVRSPQAVAMLVSVNILWFVLCGLHLRLLVKLVKPFVTQSIVLISLYVLQQGYPAGVSAGLQISCQLLLTLVPGMVLLWSSSPSQLAQSIGRFLPTQASFVLASSLHFFPLALADMTALYQVQVLKGARLSVRDLLCPWCWPDFITCLVVPTVVQALALTSEIAMAAKARNFHNGQRSCWSEE